MTEFRKLRVFISYTSQDKSAICALGSRLKAEAQVDPWLYEEKLLPGQDWEMEIAKAIREADAILVCLSKESIKKEGFIQKEFKDALDMAKEKPEGTIYLIPLLIDDCDPPMQFQRWQWVDLSSAENFNKLVTSLEIRAESLGIKKDIVLTPEGQPRKSPIRAVRSLKDEGSQVFRSVIEMLLGFMFPVFSCLVISIALASRKYIEGIWTNGVSEIVVTSIIFFGLLLMSLILFMVGFGRLTSSVMNAGARVDWTYFFQSAWKTISSKQGFNKQVEAFQGAIKTFWAKENWIDPEFKGRAKAALKSLIFPGWGLWSRGRVWLGITMLILTGLGYLTELPGILLHLITIVLSGVLDIPKSKVIDESVWSAEVDK